MYDPSLGRWLTPDPIGFQGGDVNLYAYVGNNPANRLDPTGLIGIMFDGNAYTAGDDSIVARFVFYYTNESIDRKDFDNEAHHVGTDQGDLMKKVDAAYALILNARKVNPNEPIDIFGWSRGGIAAIALAKKLEAEGIKVRFLGLIDPTAPLKNYTEDKAFLKLDLKNLGPNVENAAVCYRDGKNDGNYAKAQWYKTLFTLTIPKFSDKTKVLLTKEYPLNHLQTGFSRDVAIALRNAARMAGVPLPAEDVYSDPKFDDTPKSAESWATQMEKFVRTALGG